MFKAQSVTIGPERRSWTVTGPEFLPVAPAEEFLSYLSAGGRSPTTVETYAYAGFALGDHHDAELTTRALQMAVAIRGSEVRGVIFHSDKGSEGVHRLGIRERLCPTGRHPVDGPGRLGSRQRNGREPILDAAA